jgi:hypothetical protein
MTFCGSIPLYIQEDHVGFRMVFGTDRRFGAPPPPASHSTTRSVGTGVFVSSFSSFGLRTLPITHEHCCICDVSSCFRSLFAFILFKNLYYCSVTLGLLTGVAVFDVSLCSLRRRSCNASQRGTLLLSLRFCFDDFGRFRAVTYTYMLLNLASL